MEKETTPLEYPEPLPAIIEYDKRIADKMDSVFKENDVSFFIGNVLISTLFYSYLFNKYGMKCAEKRNKTSSLFILDILSTIETTLSNPINIKNLNNCANSLSHCIMNITPTKLVIYPFTFQIYKGDTLIDGHANLFLYRPEINGLEHFEPHGNKFFGGRHSSFVNTNLQAIIEKIVSDVNTKINNMSKHIHLIKSSEICPAKIKGLQALEGKSTLVSNLVIEPGGYCAAWSMFFAEVCLKNPTISSKDVFSSIIKHAKSKSENSNLSDYLRKLIRGYTVFINNKIGKYFAYILDEPDLNTTKLTDAFENRRGNEDAFRIMDNWMKLTKAEYPNFKHDSMFKTPLLNNSVQKRLNEFKQQVEVGTSPEDRKRISNISITSVKQNLFGPTRRRVKHSVTAKRGAQTDDVSPINFDTPQKITPIKSSSDKAYTSPQKITPIKSSSDKVYTPIKIQRKSTRRKISTKI